MSTAIVTGDASGMGRATTEVLVASGWNVLALDRVADRYHVGERTVKTTPVDVTDRGEVRRAIGDHVTGSGSPISLVANVAGVYPLSTIDDFTEEHYRTVFDVNVLGVLNVTAEAVPHMQSGGAVVNFASVDAFTVSPGQLLYGASKAAVVMITKSLALELAARGIRVNAIAPGWVDTPGNAATGRGRGRRVDPPRPGRPTGGDRALGGTARRPRRRVHDRRDDRPLGWRRHPLTPARPGRTTQLHATPGPLLPLVETYRPPANGPAFENTASGGRDLTPLTTMVARYLFAP